MKIGGSLALSEDLAAWSNALAACPHPLVLVPGGGPLADQVRLLQDRWRFDDALAHHLAILAMEQFGRILASFHPAFEPAASKPAIRRALAEGRSPVWLPSRMVLGRPEIEESWRVTSDSLAAWLADRLGAETLILVKSRRPAEVILSPAEAVAQDLIDPAFPAFIAGKPLTTWCVGADESRLLQGLIEQGEGGTRIVDQPTAGPSVLV